MAVGGFRQRGTARVCHRFADRAVAAGTEAAAKAAAAGGHPGEAQKEKRRLCGNTDDARQRKTLYPHYTWRNGECQMIVGDFVRGLPGSPYSITTEAMTRGVVKSVNGDIISVMVLDHAKGNRGTFDVDKQYFEVIGHVKPFVRKDALELLKSGCKKALLDYDLSEADLSEADLSEADLSEADLRGADLRGANLSEANLSEADLSEANLRGADLRGADLDFSCFPLWCGGLHIKTDVRLAAQVAYHLCTMQCDDTEYIAMRRGSRWKKYFAPRAAANG